MEYKITLKNQFKVLRFLLFGTLLYCGVIYVFLKKEQGHSTDMAFDAGIELFFLIYYLVFLIPTLFLHIEYYLINKNNIVAINTTEGTISINNQQSIPFNQIEKIFLLMSPVLYRNDKIHITPFDDYHYAIIQMKEGKKFVFTSLMDFRVEEAMKQISGVPIEKKKRFIASPLLGRYWFLFWS